MFVKLLVWPGVIELGPKTKALRILIPFGGGRCWSKEYNNYGYYAFF